MRRGSENRKERREKRNRKRAEGRKERARRGGGKGRGYKDDVVVKMISFPYTKTGQFLNRRLIFVGT